MTARYSRDALLHLRSRRAGSCPDILQSPRCLLLPGSLVVTPTTTATFEEEAIVALLQVAGRPLSLRILLSMAQLLQLGISNEPRRAAVAAANRKAAGSEENQAPHDEAADDDDDETQVCDDGAGPVHGVSFNLEDLVRAWIRRRPDLFCIRAEPLELDTEVELLCSVPLALFRIPPFRILSEVVPGDESGNHLIWLSRALAKAEPRFVALFPKTGEEIPESKAENLVQLFKMQEALLTSVYGYVKKKMQFVQEPAANVPQMGGDDEKKFLLRAFQKHIEQDGYLSSSAVRMLLDAVCHRRELNAFMLLSDRRLGPIFLTQLRMHMFIDTTIWAAISLLPIVTYHDLELTIMKGADFRQLHCFTDCGLGSLRYHPMVAHFFFEHEELQTDPPTDFPKITGAQLLSLMLKSWLNDDCDFNSANFEKKWSLEGGLIAAAQSLGLDHYWRIGVHVQREFLSKFIVKSALKHRNEMKKRWKALVQESVTGGHLGTFPSWDHDRWRTFFEKLKGLSSIPEQLLCIKEVIQAEILALRNMKDDEVEASVEKTFAPLLLLAISAAHVSCKADERKTTADLAHAVQQLQELLPAGRNLEEAAEALRTFPVRETSLAKALLASEQAIAHICGLRCPSELPLTLPQLLQLRRELAEALPQPEDFGRGGVSLTGCGETEQSVAQQLREQVNASLLSLESGDVGISDLLKALGRSESTICQQCSVTSFGELQLEVGFGELLARNCDELAKMMGRFVHKAGSGKLQSDLSRFCTELKAAQVPTSESLSAILDHFGAAVTSQECHIAWDQAAAFNPCEGSTVESVHIIAAGHSGASSWQKAAARVMENEEMLQHVVDSILRAPVLMNLRDVFPDWTANFQQALGEFSAFLSSKAFLDAWEAQCHGSYIYAIQWEHFVRLPTCTVTDFVTCVEARDAAGAAGVALRRWLQDGIRFPAEQFADATEEGYKKMVAGKLRETFVLQALVSLPVKFREAVSRALVKPYLDLALPRSNMIAVAKQSAQLTAALRWLAKFTGNTDWELDWQEQYPVYIPGEVHATRDRCPAEAPASQPRERAETSDADSSDGGHISEETDTDQDSEDLARSEDSANRKLCRKIARDKGVKLEHVNTVTRNWEQRPMSGTLRSLQTTVQGAVKRLSADRYSGEVHFMLELLQNADDCEFPQGVTPSLKVTFESDAAQFGEYTTFRPSQPPQAFLVIEHNETGFRDSLAGAGCRQSAIA
eukprot:s160_g9.t1